MYHNIVIWFYSNWKLYFSLLYVEIGVGNKIVYSYFEWINKKSEPIREAELDMANLLINLKIQLNSHQQEYDDWIKSNSSSLAKLRLEK